MTHDRFVMLEYTVFIDSYWKKYIFQQFSIMMTTALYRKANPVHTCRLAATASNPVHRLVVTNLQLSVRGITDNHFLVKESPG